MFKKTFLIIALATSFLTIACSQATKNSQENFQIQSNSQTYFAKTPAEYSFKILDQNNTALDDFDITHTKAMHVIIVNKDLSSFQHLHPAFNKKTLEFTLKDLTFPTNGDYRIFTDFMTNKKSVTSFEDVKVGNNYQPQSLGSEEKIKNFGDYKVTLKTHEPLQNGTENTLMFTISQNDQPVTNLEEYLGALGHTVILKEKTLDFIHTHPIEMAHKSATVDFAVTFPSPGKYKIFSQFQHNGKVFLTDFVVNVEQGNTNENNSIQNNSDHSEH